ncbi:MAG TPA: hypothetical protein VGH37_04470 [Candidatus Acidoferrum sp.]
MHWLKTADTVIVGSGSLAQGIVYALSQVAKDSLRVAIIGRSAAKISRIALIANARAETFHVPATFCALAIRDFRALAFSRAFRSLKPKVILLAASLQSPWESSQGQNAWTKLIASGGFGITLPLQLALAAELSRGATDSKAAIVNACYPDCVNVVLHRLQLPVTCGVGNAAIVEAFCASRDSMGQDGTGRGGLAVGKVKVVAHHGQLSAWLRGKASESQPRVWVKDREKNSLRLRPNFGDIRDDLNGVTAATATPVLLSLLTGEILHTSIPGVAGMPGGYPFVLKDGRFVLRLPSGLTTGQAIAHNKKGERLDGLDLESDAKFTGKARRALAEANFEYAEGFDLAGWPKVCSKLVALRERLRQVKV